MAALQVQDSEPLLVRLHDLHVGILHLGGKVRVSAAALELPDKRDELLLGIEAEVVSEEAVSNSVPEPGLHVSGQHRRSIHRFGSSRLSHSVRRERQDIEGTKKWLCSRQDVGLELEQTRHTLFSLRRRQHSFLHGLEDGREDFGFQHGVLRRDVIPQSVTSGDFIDGSRGHGEQRHEDAGGQLEKIRLQAKRNQSNIKQSGHRMHNTLFDIIFSTTFGKMEFTFSFPVPDVKGCDQSLVEGARLQLTCPNEDSSHQGFESHSLYDVGDATKATLLAGYNTMGHQHLIGCKRREDGLYSCSVTLLTDSVLGDPDSFNPRAHVELQRCQGGATLGTIVCQRSAGAGIGQ